MFGVINGKLELDTFMKGCETKITRDDIIRYKLFLSIDLCMYKLWTIHFNDADVRNKFSKLR